MSHVALIFGGPSAEHDVSLVSAKNIYQVLKDTEFKTSLLGITKHGQWRLINADDLLSTSFKEVLDLEKVGQEVQLLQENNKVFIAVQGQEKMGPIDAAFPIIHGPYGEDGQLQKELNAIGLSFVGSDAESCENSFDKAKTKEVIESAKIPQTPYLVCQEVNPEFQDVKAQLGLPFFVKPANMGSSLGISKVSCEEEFIPALAEARVHDKKIVIEKGVSGRELECAILENGKVEVSGLGEVKPNHDFYSYEAKYLDPNGADLIIPAKVDAKIAAQIQEMAKTCFKALGCRDFARADFFLSDNGEILFNEINTHPGFTSISQFPMLWWQEGLEYRDLIIRLINQSIKRTT